MNDNQSRMSSSDGQEPRRRKPKKNSIGRRVWRTVAAVVMVCIILGCVAGCVLTLFVFDALESSQTVQLNLNQLKLDYTSIIYAKDPTTSEFKELQRLEGDAGSRIWLDYEQMPPQLFDVLISVEDKRFKEHNGVDFLGTTKAFGKMILNKIGLASDDEVRGASTITQQLVRNVTNDKEDSIARKLREIFRALKLERSYSKDQILESYLNTVPFGNNTNGIQAAANLYFSKDIKELSVAQMASIVGITKSPTFYNPYLTKENNEKGIEGYKNNQQRKEDILFLMHQQGKLTDKEYEAALAEHIVFNTDNNERRVAGQQSYFVDYLMNQVIGDLSTTLNISRTEAQSRLINGGYRIYSTVDTTVQTKLENIYEHPEEYMPKVKNKDEYPQSAFIITDPNGAIRGLVGGTGKKEGARIWNRATDTQRQPGSTIKPISSYALAFENDLVHWSSMLLDGPYSLQIDKQPPWQPKDYYGKPKGYMVLEEALQRSCNLIPVRLVEMLTPKVVWSFLHDTLGMSSLAESDKAPSPMSLGALTNGVTPLELAGAYQMYSNGGTYTPPYSYTKVLDSKGNVILERNITPTRVITFDTATIVNKLMQRVVTGPYGTGRAASLAKTNPSMPVAGKTGTTDEDVDQWFVGLTPYYVGICWMGFDDPFIMETDAQGNKTPKIGANGKPVPHTIHYSNYPPPILWNTVMSSVHEGLEAKPFPTSSNVVSLTYCLDTGFAATTACEHTSTGWYKTANVPPLCPMHGFGGLTEIPYHVAGTKPWLDALAPFDPQWAFLYPNTPKAFDEFGDPIIPSIETEE